MNLKPVKTITLHRMQWYLFLMGIFKIPMIGYSGLKLKHLDDNEAKAVMKLRRRTKNHLNSMYFGALSVGADVSAGIHAFYHAERYGKKVSFAFKGMKAEFLKRAESDCTFVSKNGNEVEKAILESSKTGERLNFPTEVLVYDMQNELVAKFELTISIKIL